MSGGHFNYYRPDLSIVSRDRHVKARWPVLAKILDGIGDTLQQAISDMDDDLSGDSKIQNDQEFQIKTASYLIDAILKPLPDDPRTFPHGKWATIQAWQQRLR